jgi:allophanate hydrolase subunit 1
MAHDPVISMLGTTALLLEAHGETSLETQQTIWSLSAQVCNWPEVLEAVPFPRSLSRAKRVALLEAMAQDTVKDERRSKRR